MTKLRINLANFVNRLTYTTIKNNSNRILFIIIIILARTSEIGQVQDTSLMENIIFDIGLISASTKQHVKETIKHGGGGIIVWGSFTCWNIAPLVTIHGTMKKKDYFNILHINLPAFNDESAYNISSS